MGGLLRWSGVRALCLVGIVRLKEGGGEKGESVAAVCGLVARATAAAVAMHGAAKQAGAQGQPNCLLMLEIYVIHTHAHARPPAAARPPGQQLAVPLPLSSLHILSEQDRAVSAAQSRQLAAQFEASRRQMLEHDLGQ